MTDEQLAAITYTDEDGKEQTIDEFTLHEMTDRLFACIGIFDQMVVEHPAAFIVQEYHEKIAQLLFDAYQFSASTAFDTFEADTAVDFVPEDK